MSGPSGAAPARRSSRALLVVLAVAALARLSGLGREGLWNDEVLSILMSRGSLGEVIAAARQDVHPPLHLLLDWLWQPVAGRSEWLWRLPSALCGIAAVGLTWRLGRRLVSRRAALLASILAATSTMAIYYSQEARSYSLLMLLTLVALERALAWEASRRRRDAALLALATFLLLATHYFGALALLVFGLWMLLRLLTVPRAAGGRAASAPDWRGIAAFAAAQGAALVAFVPWLLAARGQLVRAGDDFWLPSPQPHWAALTLGIFTGLARPVWGGSRITLGELGWGLAVTLPLAAAGTWLAARGRVEERDEPARGSPAPAARRLLGALLIAWLCVPAAVAYALSQGPLHLYTHRNLIVSLPAWWLLAGAVSERIAKAWLRAFAVALVLAPTVSGSLWYYGTTHKEQWRELAAEVAQGLRDDDHVSVEDAWLVEVFRFHLGDRPYRALAETSPAALRDVRRLWLIRGPANRPEHLARVNRELAALQASGFRVETAKRFVGAELVLLARPAPPTLKRE